MIKIEAIIPPFKLPDIIEALDERVLDHLLVLESKVARDPDYVVAGYRGIECSLDFLQSTKIELFVDEHDCAGVLASIQGAMNGSRSHTTITTCYADRVFDPDCSVSDEIAIDATSSARAPEWSE